MKRSHIILALIGAAIIAFMLWLLLGREIRNEEFAPAREPAVTGDTQQINTTEQAEQTAEDESFLEKTHEYLQLLEDAGIQ